MMKIVKILLVLVVLAIVLTSCSAVQSNQNCTIFTATNENHVYYANNEDTHFKDLIIGFVQATENNYGFVRYGYAVGEVQNYQGAVNDKGLVWDINSVPKTKLNAHPEKPFSHDRDNYLSVLSRRISTVEEAVQLAHQFDFGESMSIQIHIADASGDAVVIGPGPDGEITYTRKEDRFLVSTNFSLTDDGKNKCWRYDKATEMLTDIGTDEFSVDYLSKIVEEVRLRTATSFTLYSNIVDLTDMKIYLYYMSRYDERVELDIDAELAKGNRVIEMRSLFSQATVDAGDADYNRFEIWFTVYKIAMIALGVMVLSSIIVVIIVLIRKRKKKHE